MKLTLGIVIRLLRVKQWIKNFLLFAAPLFGGVLFFENTFKLAVTGFGVFCLVSSAIYIVNDVLDREQDQIHPEKKKRPIASGEVHVRIGLIVAALCFVLAFGLLILLPVGFSVITAVYIFQSMLYSFYLKRFVFIDIILIALGFVWRALAGSVTVNVIPSPWFLLCTFLLALFVAINKRRAELSLLDEQAPHHRANLQNYSFPLLDQMNAVVTSSTLMAYSLWTFSSGRSPILMITIPFVVFGIFRYQFLSVVKKQGGSPESVVLMDRPTQINLILWVLSCSGILYFDWMYPFWGD